MKSTPIEDQGASGTFNGRRSLIGFDVDGFFLEHDRQFLTCSLTCILRLSKQMMLDKGYSTRDAGVAGKYVAMAYS